uniref:Uncharacterized protein n=1 Tax=Arundo donax TaxID=35708 RepID=A0A0A9BHQ2_ARUDO
MAWCIEKLPLIMC